MLEKCTQLWRKAHLEVKMWKNCSLRGTFLRAYIGKMHAAVAKGIGRSDVELWRTRRCGEKHICQWKCWKTVVFGALLEVLISKVGFRNIVRLAAMLLFAVFFVDIRIWDKWCVGSGTTDVFQVKASSWCIFILSVAIIAVGRCSERAVFLLISGVGIVDDMS